MRILKPTFERSDKRGLFVEILNGIKLKNLSYGAMKKGAVMGNHYHKKTKVVFFLTGGLAKVDLLDVETGATETVTIEKNEGIELPSGNSHAIRFLENSSFIMGKSEKYDSENPDTYELTVPEVK